MDVRQIASVVVDSADVDAFFLTLNQLAARQMCSFLVFISLGLGWRCRAGSDLASMLIVHEVVSASRSLDIPRTRSDADLRCH